MWFPWTETDFHPGMKVHSGGDQDRVGEKWSEVVSKWKNSFMLVGGREVKVPVRFYCNVNKYLQIRFEYLDYGKEGVGGLNFGFC